MPQFKPGEKVRLKSGGPAMTVEEIASNGRVVCQWFDKDKNLRDGMFPPDSLEPYEPGPGIGIG